MAKKAEPVNRWGTMDREIRGQIGALLAQTGMTRTELCEVIGMTTRTLCTRMKHPETFVLRELRAIADIAGQNHMDFYLEMKKERREAG